MNLLETVRVAGHALLRNKLRSFLTALGMIIGVGAVIAMVALGEGAKAQVQASYSSMGTNLLIVLPGSTSAGGAQGGFGSQPTITWEDVRAIRNELPQVVAAVAPASRATAQLQSEGANWTTSVTGTVPEYFEARSWNMEKGAVFGASDLEGGTKVVILGQTVAERLFGANADPVGHAVRIRNIPFTVVGVMERKGQSPTGQDYDDNAFVPLSTFSAKIQANRVTNYFSGILFVQARSAELASEAERAVAALLRDRHRIPPGGDDDFSVRSLTEMAGAQAQGVKTMTTLLASIAAVSLLVGGIGIMNIMLVSVTERTREIGLRMAVGARPRDVLVQFLTEALVLSLVGGALGVALGVLGAGQLARGFGWPTLIRGDITALALGVSAICGVTFGLYPARKASKLDPIEALRWE